LIVLVVCFFHLLADLLYFVLIHIALHFFTFLLIFSFVHIISSSPSSFSHLSSLLLYAPIIFFASLLSLPPLLPLSHHSSSLFSSPLNTFLHHISFHLFASSHVHFFYLSHDTTLLLLIHHLSFLISPLHPSLSHLVGVSGGGTSTKDSTVNSNSRFRSLSPPTTAKTAKASRAVLDQVFRYPLCPLFPPFLLSLLCPVLSCHVMSCPVLSCLILSYPVLYFFLFYPLFCSLSFLCSLIFLLTIYPVFTLKDQVFS
jgi:hypothetical protein